MLTYAMFPELGREFLEQRKAGELQPEALEPMHPGGDGVTGRPTEFNVTLHGETYHIKVTGTGHDTEATRPFYLTVDGVPEEILIETLAELEPRVAVGERPVTPSPKGSRRPKATRPGHVTTSMPGTIIEVLVKPDDHVKAGDPLLVTEAMKMETEIQAPIAGRIVAVHVGKGDSVNPDETLIEIEA
jgi:pyruvate carboxylase subunit B